MTVSGKIAVGRAATIGTGRGQGIGADGVACQAQVSDEVFLVRAIDSSTMAASHRPYFGASRRPMLACTFFLASSSTSLFE